MITTHKLACSIAALGAFTLAASIGSAAQAGALKIRGADAYAGADADTFMVAIADNRGNAKERANSNDRRDDARDRVDQRDIDRVEYRRLGDDQRRIARDYYARNCPPGLARKNNGCLPPGLAKKRYEVGRRLYDGYEGERLPYDLYSRLPVLPDAYEYRLLDGDLGIVELSTLMVLDAIGLT